MLFNSFEYIFYFLPLIIAGYALVRRFSTAQMGVAFLSLASMVFYLWWDINNLGILIGAILVNYAFGRLMVRCGEESGAVQTLKRSALIAGIVFNIGLLAYYKYANFLAREVGLDIDHIVLPLGISFFTFQKITYLVDCYHGLLSEAGLIEFSLFVGYFPHAIAGPIVHHRDMMPQFLHPKPALAAETFRTGLVFFAIGLAKKVLIADTFAPIATEFFRAASQTPDAARLFESWQGVLAYAMQIYFDFSGYSDMAVGAGLMMGIRLPLNFDSPYRSLSVIDFWRRWHMTLSRFLKEYIYFPFGGSRRGALRHYVNLMFVMLVGGFWHGANWTFLAWGGLHGLYLMVNHAWRNFGPTLPLRAPRIVMVPMSWIGTFGAVCVAWAFFRADSLTTALGVVRGMLGLNGIALAEPHRAYLGALGPRLQELGVHFLPPAETTLHFSAYAYVIAAIAACLLLPNTQMIAERLPKVPTRSRLALASALGALAAITICELERPSEFLYFNF
jgi:D-alanyl-lipoteichoic acid acyltransferase DltB (MBOAT superfamily)